MTRAVVFGATGYVGSKISAELLDREIEVIAVARRDPISPTPRLGLATIRGSLFDPGLIERCSRGSDLIAVAIPALGRDGRELAEAVPTLLDAAAHCGARLGIVGGSGTLRLHPGGPTVMSQARFPEAFRPEALAQERVLHALIDADTSADWFYLSPPTMFGAWHPGERRGEYRLGTDFVVRDARGRAEISGADFALAFVDEALRPKHHRIRFTVGY